MMAAAQRTVSAEPPRFSRSPHLVTLIAEAERLVAAIGSAAAPARAAHTPATDEAAALASLRLDGSDLDAAPTAERIAAARATSGLDGSPPTGGSGGRRGTWFEAMRVDEQLDPEHTLPLRALEYAGVVDALTADDLVGGLTTRPDEVLAELHRRLTAGLVAPERAGAHRQVEQAVHDASTGRILFFTADPEVVPAELGLLQAWLAGASAREHGLVAAGVVHLELLRIHPFDAANGRLARAAARLVLRARGLDPDRLALAEPALDADRLGYHDEVARTMRRRDLTIWLERWGEAVTDGLRRSARTLGVLDVEVPRPAVAFVDGRDEPFTVVDYQAEAGRSADERRGDLEALLDAGRVVRVPGSRGLRFAVRHTDSES